MEHGVLIIRHAGQTRRYDLRLGGNGIGRDGRNDVVLADPQVSAFHARILCTATDCRIIDLKSTNGTLHNGAPLKPQVEYTLRSGDRLQIGPYTIHYARTVQAPSVTRELPPEVAGRLPQGDGRTALVAAGEGRRPPVFHPVEGRSSYWRFLPPFYEEADFAHEDPAQNGVMDGLLHIFESILAPLDLLIDQIDWYFDPHTAPEALLPWLATWVDLVLNENWSLDQRRALIRRAAELYRWRGTRKGLRDAIAIYTGVAPAIVEPAGDRALPAHTFRVVIDLPDARTLDERLLRQIIEAEKPAHTGYELVIRRTAKDVGARE